MEFFNVIYIYMYAYAHGASMHIFVYVGERYIYLCMKLLYCIMESTVDSYEKRNTINKTSCRYKVHMNKRKRRNEFET